MSARTRAWARAMVRRRLPRARRGGRRWSASRAQGEPEPELSSAARSGTGAESRAGAQASGALTSDPIARSVVLLCPLLAAARAAAGSGFPLPRRSHPPLLHPPSSPPPHPGSQARLGPPPLASALICHRHSQSSEHAYCSYLALKNRLKDTQPLCPI